MLNSSENALIRQNNELICKIISIFGRIIAKNRIEKTFNSIFSFKNFLIMQVF